MRKLLWLFAFGLALAIFPVPTNAQTGNLLPIPPVLQRSTAWCWLATGEMIFRYYGVPANDLSNYQCGEARFQGAFLTGIPNQPFAGPCWMNCALCANIGSGPVQGIVNMLTQYPAAMRIVTRNPISPVLQPPQTAAAVPSATIKSEIDAGHPLIAGISPSSLPMPPGLAEHAVLIVGYSQSGNIIILNDPFPYQAAGMTPPYLQAGGAALALGRFEISYAAMVSALNWNTTVFGIGL
jgi:hypothetical protein